VLSNPPYIARDILEKPFGKTCKSLQPEVLGYEPHLALNGGERGIQSISRIAEDLEKILKSGGWFFMEIGADQAEEVFDIFKGTTSYDNIAVHNDYAGLPRVFQAQKQSK
jgi:release factor glutamine methyltransferase